MDLEITKSDNVNDILQDPDFVAGSNEFQLPNGDKYIGQYLAHRSGLLWREGLGIYTTNDGDCYNGFWKNDKLVEDKEVIIKYVNSAKFTGYIVDRKYNGPGEYEFDNGLKLLCNFYKNVPSGELTLIDKSGSLWKGETLPGTSTALFREEHIFYTTLNRTRGIGKLKSKLTKPKPAVVEEVPQLTKEQLERQTFNKSNLTPSDLQFENSEWYQRYLRFKAQHSNVMSKLKKTGIGSLDENELKWYIGYTNFKNTRKQTKTKQPDNKLFEIYYSDEYQMSCPAVSVFYPTKETE